MEEKKIDELLKEIYGEQTNALERMGKIASAWRFAAAAFAAAFAITLVVLFYLITHPLRVEVKGLPVRGVGAFGMNVVTKEQLAEFGKNASYLLCNLDISNIADRFDALETISLPSWAAELRKILPSTTSKFRELQMSQMCSVRDKEITVKPLGRNRFLVKVPADMTYWIKGRVTKGKRVYSFTVVPCPSTGKNPYGYCIESWEIEDAKR